MTYTQFKLGEHLWGRKERSSSRAADFLIKEEKGSPEVTCRVRIYKYRLSHDQAEALFLAKRRRTGRLDLLRIECCNGCSSIQ
jgi:hypothetical protein